MSHSRRRRLARGHRRLSWLNRSACYAVGEARLAARPSAAARADRRRHPGDRHRGTGRQRQLEDWMRPTVREAPVRDEERQLGQPVGDRPWDRLSASRPSANRRGMNIQDVRQAALGPV